MCILCINIKTQLFNFRVRGPQLINISLQQFSSTKANTNFEAKVPQATMTQSKEPWFEDEWAGLALDSVPDPYRW